MTLHENPARPVRILLVEDHKSMIWGLEKLIESEGPGMVVVGRASSLTEALAAAEQHRPDVMLLDLDLGEDSGLDVLIGLRQHVQTKVVVLTGLKDAAIYERAVFLGARGLVHKTEPAETILAAVRCVHGGELWLNRATTAKVFAAMLCAAEADGRNGYDGRAVLTPAERKIIAAVVKHKGAPSKCIADALHISTHTLRNHLASIYGKLNVHTRLDLVLYAMENDLGAEGSRGAGEARAGRR